MFFDNPADNALFAAIGRLTVSWSHLESAIDLAVIYFFRDGGNPAKDKEKPKTALNKKLDYLKRTVRKLEILTRTEVDNWIAVFDAISAEAITRQDIIHGATIEHEEGTGVAISARIIHSPSGIEGKLTEISAHQINVATMRVAELTSVMQRFAYELRILPRPSV